MSSANLPAPVRGCWRGILFATLLCRWMIESRGLQAAGVRERALWRQKQSLRAMRILNIRLLVLGTPPADGLVVSNHLGYVDIFTLGAVLPGSFVSKAEVAGWPIVGEAARAAGTLFVQRDSIRSAAEVSREIASLLNQGEQVAVFPEGTSSEGDSVLPFQSPLFDAAARTGAPVHTAALTYTIPAEEGIAAERVAYWGDMTIGPHLLGLLCVSGIQATLRFSSEPVAPSADRRRLAESAHAAVCALVQRG